jgi:hypothetical protein
MILLVGKAGTEGQNWQATNDLPLPQLQVAEKALLSRVRESNFRSWAAGGGYERHDPLFTSNSS